MDLDAERARLNATLALPDWVLGTVQNLIDQAQEQAAEALRLSEQISRRDSELHAAEIKIQALTLELAHLRRMRFGARSEAFSPEERDLFQETLASDIAAAQAELARKQAEAEATGEPQVPSTPRLRAGRQRLPEHLPRIEHRHEPDSCTCGRCGKALVKIGEDISEQLDVEPARFFVHRHIRPPHLPILRLPCLRDGVSRTDPCRGHRWWHGRSRLVRLGDCLQIPRSPCATNATAVVEVEAVLYQR